MQTGINLNKYTFCILKSLEPLCGAPGNFSATLSLLNLLEESLGRSKPATNLMQEQ